MATVAKMYSLEWGEDGEAWKVEAPIISLGGDERAEV